jgi:hypothetical protein
MGPGLKGFETFDVLAFAFLITHTDNKTGSERKILFDLGPPKNWEDDLPKAVVDRVKTWGAEISMDRYTSEVLEENGIALDSIEAIIWR